MEGVFRASVLRPILTAGGVIVGGIFGLSMVSSIAIKGVQTAVESKKFRTLPNLQWAKAPQCRVCKGKGFTFCKPIFFGSDAEDAQFFRATLNPNCKVELSLLGQLQETDMLDDLNLNLVVTDEGEAENLSESKRWIKVKKNLTELLSNAEKRSQGVYHIRKSLGVDLGDARTGVAISLKGYAPRPLSVVKLKGDKLVFNLLETAGKERADEFIVGLPLSFDGKETLQSRKVRSFAGRLASLAAEKGWRVYLLDEFGSSQDGLDSMLEMGVKKKSRKGMIDAYAAMVLLQRYFSREGGKVKLVVPKGISLQEKLALGDNSAVDDFDIDFGF